MWIAFAFASIVVIVVPGPDVLLTLTSTVGGGRRAGIAAAAGIVVASATQATLALLGLAAVLANSEAVFRLVKYAGAVYLIWLGVRALAAARRDAHDPLCLPEPTSLRTRFVRGLATNLLNVKVTLFYVTFAPQFLDSGAATTATLGAMYAVFLALAVAWLVLVVVAANELRALANAPRVRHAIDLVFGVTLIGFGYRVLRTAQPS